MKYGASLVAPLLYCLIKAEIICQGGCSEIEPKEKAAEPSIQQPLFPPDIAYFERASIMDSGVWFLFTTMNFPLILLMFHSTSSALV